MFDNALVDMHKAKEKLIHDTWVIGCGIELKITPLLLKDADSAKIVHDHDIMGIDINYVSSSGGTFTKFGELFNRYTIIINEQYEQISISSEIMNIEVDDSGDVNNHNELYCYISGEIVPKYSLVEFAMYGTIKYRIENITKKRPQSDIRVYRLVRA